MTDQGARNDALTELLRDISATETEIPVLSVAPLSDSGRVWIDGERITYTGKTQGDPSYLNGCTRGVDQEEGGTEARPHNGGDYVWQDNPRTAGVGLIFAGGIPIGFGVTQQNLNAIFGATYQNYLVVIRLLTQSAAADIWLRLLTATDTPNTSFSYFSTLTLNTSGTVTGSAADGADHWRLLTGAAVKSHAKFALWVADPASGGLCQMHGTGSHNNGSSYPLSLHNGGYNAATAFTGIQLLPASGNITGGEIRAYGLRDV